MRLGPFALMTALLLAAARPGEGLAEPTPADVRYLAGQFLIASPEMRDPRFATTVIFMVEHDGEGALGIIVNKVYGKGSLANLMKGFGLDPGSAAGAVDLHFGGPVSATAAFILHTTDYAAERSRPVAGPIAFTTDVDILSAVAAGRGPRRLLFALGCAGWGPGQLEREMEDGDWTVAPASEELVFGAGGEDLWKRLSETSGVPL